MNTSQTIDLSFEIGASNEGAWRYEDLHLTKFRVQVPVINGEPVIPEINYAISDIVNKMVANVLTANKAKAEQDAKDAADLAAAEVKITDLPEIIPAEETK